MKSSEFSVGTLTDDQARQIAEAYVRGEKDPPRMARLLGVDSFDLNLIMLPRVRSYIVQMQRVVRAEYSLHDHIDKLKEIRDAALGDENFKVALAAETQLGKAAGHYDPKPASDDLLPGEQVDPTKLSTGELRRRLAGMIGAVIPQGEEQPHALPDPTLDSETDDEVDASQI